MLAKPSLSMASRKLNGLLRSSASGVRTYVDVRTDRMRNAGAERHAEVG